MLQLETHKNNIDNLFAITDLTEVETQSIIDCLRQFDCPKYLEIGVYFGGTFVKILNYLKNNKSSYTCVGVDLFEDIINEVDNYNNRFKPGIESQTHVVLRLPHEIEGGKLNTCVKNELKEKLLNNGCLNFELVKGYSDSVLPTLNQKFDVMFIDGNHTYVQALKDFNNCYNLSKIGSYFIFHNTTEKETRDAYHDGGPYKVCEELKSDKRLEYIGMFDGTKIFKRII